MKIIWALIGALGVLSMNAAAADAGQIEEGKQVYQYWCWNCHGEGVGKPGTRLWPLNTKAPSRRFSMNEPISLRL